MPLLRILFFIRLHEGEGENRGEWRRHGLKYNIRVVKFTVDVVAVDIKIIREIMYNFFPFYEKIKTCIRIYISNKIPCRRPELSYERAFKNMKFSEVNTKYLITRSGGAVVVQRAVVKVYVFISFVCWGGR